jgi:hypothetical protein
MPLDSMKSTNPVKKLHPQIQEKIDYVSSPLYKRRLLALGQPKETVDKLISDRVNELKKTNILYNANLPDAALALTDKYYDQPIIKLRNADNPKYQSGSALAHEIGHVTSGLYNQPLQYTPNYNPIQNESGYGYNIPESRKEFENLISSGQLGSMSPKEKLFIDLQNKEANFVAPKGSGIYKMTGGTSLNDYFYNKNKSYNEAWPLGTNVDLNEPSQSNVKLNDLSRFINNDYIESPSPYKPIKKSLDIMKNKAYNDEFLSKPHYINLYNQGIPNRFLDPSGNPFSGKLLSHTYSAFENKADLDAVRYLLKKYNYTKSYGEDITPELWQKALKDDRIKNDEQIQRMRKNFDDKAIINLNNKVAYNASPLNVMKKEDNA